jgi:hypothetical protein
MLIFAWMSWMSVWHSLHTWDVPMMRFMRLDYQIGFSSFQSHPRKLVFWFIIWSLSRALNLFVTFISGVMVGQIGNERNCFGTLNRMLYGLQSLDPVLMLLVLLLHVLVFLDLSQLTEVSNIFGMHFMGMLSTLCLLELIWSLSELDRSHP